MPINKGAIDWSKVKNKPTTISGFGIVDAIANGQTWQNVSGSRALGTTYTNTTGKPILVNIAAGYHSTSWSLNVNGVVVGSNTTVNGYSNSETISAIIPAGGTYTATGLTIAAWAELR